MKYGQVFALRAHIGYRVANPDEHESFLAMDGSRQLPEFSSCGVFPPGRCRCRACSRDLCSLPREERLSWIRSRQPHRPWCVGWVLRAWASSHSEASSHRAHDPVKL